MFSVGSSGRACSSAAAADRGTVFGAFRGKLMRLDGNNVEEDGRRGRPLDRGRAGSVDDAVERAGADAVAAGGVGDRASRIARRRRSCGVSPSSVAEPEAEAEAVRAGATGAAKGLRLTRSGLGDHSIGVLEGSCCSSFPQSRLMDVTREIPRPVAAEVRREGMVSDGEESQAEMDAILMNRLTRLL